MNGKVDLYNNHSYVLHTGFTLIGIILIPPLRRFLPRREYTEVSLKSMPEEFEMSKDIDHQIMKKLNE